MKGVEGQLSMTLPLHLSSSSSSDEASPVRALGHKRTVSNAGSQRGRFVAPAPASQAAATLSPHSRRASLRRMQSRGKRLALLLSASPLARSLHSVALHKLGYSVLVAATAQEAVELACAQHMELLMLDWAGGGDEVVRGVRAVEAERGDEATVIVAVVDEAMSEGAKRSCQQAGCSAVIEDAAQISRLLPDIVTRCQASAAPFVYAAADASPTSTVGTIAAPS